MSYSNEEKWICLNVIHSVPNNNAIAVVNLYTELYGDRTIPSRFLLFQGFKRIYFYTVLSIKIIEKV